MTREIMGDSGGGKGLGYEPDPHRRTIATCAVIGGVLALVPLLLFLTKPTMEIPAGGFSGGFGVSGAEASRSFSVGFLFVFRLLMLFVLYRAVRRRWLAAPAAPVTRTLVVMASVLAALSVLHLLVAAVQFVQPEYRVPEMAAASMNAGTSAQLWACMILGGDRLLRARATDDERLRRRDRNSQLLLAFVCTLPSIAVLIKLIHGMVQSGADLVSAALLSLPTTAIALWTVHRMQRYRRMPLRILFAGFGWGAVVATGLGLALPLLYDSLSYQLLGHNRVVAIIDGFKAPVVEELVKAVGVLLIAVVARRWVTDLVSGLVVGAGLGLGFNFVESMFYMAAPSMGGALYQHWVRQVVGIMLMHVAFSALVGAAIGAARQVRNPRTRLAVIGCGLLTAICGHYLYNSLISLLPSMFRVSEPMFALVVLPLLVLLLLGMFLFMYLLLLRRGLRYQGAALAVELRHEANSGYDVVTAAELPVLLSPARRFRTRVDAFRRNGPRAYRRLSSLYQAQLDLGMCHWHQARQDPDRADVDLALLRRRVQDLKTGLEVRTGGGR
ncbi:PrsW family intramembrane metalloprotease [Nocardia sp. NBC_00881]|uniref:PrsW family intramembrane metalloprotease n=1 Tax=Nocardia sp. NBC_00881 TaxID=2975995 RepID=UPI0038667ED7|nr:PrsW family intramembrane metalloprotease [Nocardia sp. NBC_00881]